MNFMIALFTFAMLELAPFVKPGGADECQMRVLQPVTDDLGNHWQPGQILPVTVRRGNSSVGAYCAHGGACVPLKIGGRSATRLINCQVGPSIGGSDRLLVPDGKSAGKSPEQAKPAN